MPAVPAAFVRLSADQVRDLEISHLLSFEDLRSGRADDDGLRGMQIAAVAWLAAAFEHRCAVAELEANRNAVVAITRRHAESGRVHANDEELVAMREGIDAIVRVARVVDRRFIVVAIEWAADRLDRHWQSVLLRESEGPQEAAHPQLPLSRAA